MRITGEVSRRIANMGFICACLVVFIHCPKTADSAVQFFHRVFPGFLTYIPNAFFFMVSGFFLAGKFMGTGRELLPVYRSELTKRIHSLVVPYLILNLLWFGCVAMYRVSMTAYRFEWLDVLRGVGLWGTENPADGPLWFVRTLLLYVVTLPFAFALLRKKIVAYGVCLALLTVNVIPWDAFSCPVVMKIFRPQWMAFFLLGATLQIHGIPEIGKRVGVACLCAGAMMVFVRECGNVPEWLSRVMHWYCRPFLIAGAWSIMPSFAWPKALVGNAFPIYALHWPLVDISYVAGEKLGVYGAIFGNVFGSVVYMVCVVMITIVAALLIRRTVFGARFLLGGR